MDVKDTFSTIKKTTGKVVRTTKLNVKIANEEANLKSVYVAIGKKVHEIYSYGGSLGEFFDTKYREILEVENNLARLKSELDVVRETQTCANCGKICPSKSEFCLKCGKRFNAVFTHDEVFEPDRGLFLTDGGSVDEIIEVVPEAEIAPKKVVKKCAACGAENDPSDKFCLSCGRSASLY